MKNILIFILVVGIGAFAWWTISPLFINTTVDDQLDPAITALLENSANNPTSKRPATIAVESATIAPPLPTNPEAASDITSSSVVLEPGDTSLPIDGTTAKELPTPLVSGPFRIEDTSGHPASGQVRVIQTAEQSLIRFEDYEGTNGPDLFVYVAKDLEATEFISLGRAKGNRGNINYEVPANVDLSEYKYVMTWCKAFGVLFDYAEIN